MTKSTITREQLEEWVTQFDEDGGCDATDRQLEALIRQSLAALDSEPVATLDVQSRRPDGNKFALVFSSAAHKLPDDVYFLYRHAQQAPVVSADLLHTAASAIEDLLTTKDRTGAGVWFDLPFRLRSAANAQPAPVVPDGYVMVPMRLTAENGAKGALSGEFSETKFVNCPECFGDDECETCDGSGRIEITVPVTWTTIKEIWAKGVEHFAAAPQEVK